MADFSLRDFVATYSLPQIAKVTQGFYNETDCDDGDFSTNDVITVNSASFLTISGTVSLCMFS